MRVIGAETRANGILTSVTTMSGTYAREQVKRVIDLYHELFGGTSWCEKRWEQLAKELVKDANESEKLLKRAIRRYRRDCETEAYFLGSEEGFQEPCSMMSEVLNTAQGKVVALRNMNGTLARYSVKGRQLKRICSSLGFSGSVSDAS